MAKLLESIYAYKETFYDACYTTPNLSEEERRLISNVASNNDRKVQLESINGFDESLVSGQIEHVDKYYVITKIKCNKIDPNIKSKLNLRGNEIVHSIFIPKSEIEDVYLIDYLKDLNGIDIPYVYNEETNKYELNEGSINPLGSNDFHSNNSIETSSLDGEIFVKLLNGFLYSIENNKKYIITCTYDDIDALREYISVLIKLFPPKIANEIQYNDCNAGLDNIRFDIVIMPKQKSDNTFTLKQKGFVIDFSSFGIQDNIPKKYLLADMVEQYGIYDIKTAIAEYANSLKTALDVNKTIRIINNKKTELTDAEVGDYYNLLFNRVTLINESFDEIMQIKTTGSDGEIYDQIISINKVISLFKAQFYI